MPGHSSFGKGLPELTIAACGGVLNPTLEATYTMLKGLLGEVRACVRACVHVCVCVCVTALPCWCVTDVNEGCARQVATLFPDPYLALGGDEVSFAGCATADADVKASV